MRHNVHARQNLSSIIYLRVINYLRTRVLHAHEVATRVKPKFLLFPYTRVDPDIMWITFVNLLVPCNDNSSF